MKARAKVKRDLFAELNEGMTALGEARHGKRTLRTHAVEFKAALKKEYEEALAAAEALGLRR